MEMTTLLNNAPPGTEEFQEEAKGEGLLAVYRQQITAEFTLLIQRPADLNFIRGLEDNLLRIAADFFGHTKYHFTYQSIVLSPVIRKLN